MEKEKILVVDDEKRIVENICLCLKREGFQTVGAYDGDEAVPVFARQKFDIVLLDVSMPGIGGVKCLRQIITGERMCKRRIYVPFFKKKFFSKETPPIVKRY